MYSVLSGDCHQKMTYIYRQKQLTRNEPELDMSKRS